MSPYLYALAALVGAVVLLHLARLHFSRLYMRVLQEQPRQVVRRGAREVAKAIDKQNRKNAARGNARRARKLRGRAGRWPLL